MIRVEAQLVFALGAHRLELGAGGKPVGAMLAEALRHAGRRLPVVRRALPIRRGGELTKIIGKPCKNGDARRLGSGRAHDSRSMTK